MKYVQLTFATVLSVVLLVPACASKNRRILERSEVHAPTFTIRVTEFEEKQFPLSKFCYVFEARPSGSTEWVAIMSATTDDDNPIPRDQVRVIGEQSAYIFMQDKYAVTADGGSSWSVWNVNEGTGYVEYPGQFFIHEVTINPDGTGILVAVSRSTDRRNLQFWTADFGHSWRQQ